MSLFKLKGSNSNLCKENRICFEMSKARHLNHKEMTEVKKVRDMVSRVVNVVVHLTMRRIQTHNFSGDRY